MNDPLLVFENSSGSRVSKAKREHLFNELTELGDFDDLLDDTVSVVCYDLDFYPKAKIFCLRSTQWRPRNARVFVMEAANQFFPLRGQSPPIHHLNAVTDIFLNEETVLSYLAFFCYFVRGEEGPFLIIDDPEALFLPDIQQKKEAENWFQEPKIWGQNNDGDWKVSALVYYSNAIFRADFLVHLEGMIEMEEDVPIIADLTHKVEAPLMPEGYYDA